MMDKTRSAPARVKERLVTTTDQNPTRTDSPRDPWGQLLENVGRHQDRAAYQALFEHFGPQIKYYAMANGLASYADEIHLNPMGAVLITGFGSYHSYFKDALDKLRVNVNVFRVGTYKDAIDKDG